MEKARQRYWLQYSLDLAVKMGLRDWTIGVNLYPCQEGSNAQVSFVSGKRTATIELSANWESRLPEENRLTMTHELLHCHFAVADDHLHKAVENINKNWLIQLKSSLDLEQEYAVDAIANVIAPFMPLPPAEHKDER